MLTNSRLILMVLISSTLLSATGCKKDNDPEPSLDSEWTILGKTTNKSSNSIWENNVLYAIGTEQKRKLSVKFGVKPTTSAALKLVDYFKTPLAPNEMIIGIQEDDFFYLSTGTDNITIFPTINTDLNTNISKVIIKFANVKVGRHNITFTLLDVTTATGILSEK